MSSTIQRNPAPRSVKRRATRHESEALLKTAERAASMGSWAWAPGSGELTWSENLFCLAGLKPGEVEPSLEFLLAHVHAEDWERIEGVMAALPFPEGLEHFEHRYVLDDGEVRHWAVALAHEDTETAPRTLIGVVLDVTEQHDSDHKIEATIAVADALAKWDSLEGGLRLVGRIARAMDFQRGGLYVPQGDLLVPRALWHADGLPEEERERLLAVHIPRGVGVAGKAWESGRPVSAASVLDEPGYRHGQADSRDGLRSSLAIPASAGEQVLAVLSFFARDELRLTESMNAFFSGMGREIGEFFSHRRAELAPPPLTSRELEVLQLVAAGLTNREIGERLGIERSTVKTHLGHISERLGVSGRALAVAEAVRRGLIE